MEHKLDEKGIKEILAEYFETEPSDIEISVERKTVPGEEWYNTYTYYIVSATVSSGKD